MPNAIRTGTRTMFRLRRIGVFQMNFAPNPMLRICSPRVVCSVTSSGAILDQADHQRREEEGGGVDEEDQLDRIGRAPGSPAAANPTAVDPNWAMAMIALAAPSSSSEAISGSTLSLAGEKNCVTDDERITTT